MFIFNIDRGGTFTDFYVQKVEEGQIVEQFCYKVPSETSQGEGPIVGIKKFLSSHLGQNICKDEKISTLQIKGINIGTTIATNALLQRKGVKSVLIVNKGFDDILAIRNQARPNIFDLKCSKPQPLSNNILTIGSRIFLHQIPSQNEKLILVEPGVYYKPPCQSQLEELIENIRKINPQSIGVSLCNSYLNPVAENLISNRLLELGFKVQKGSQYIDIGYLKRTQTVSLDCFLNPIINKYFQHFVSSFDNPQNIPIRIMKSDGGFTDKNHIKSSQLLLSGPAGGLIGYSKMGDQLKKYFAFEPNTLLGLDMGGTSTDLSKVKNKQIQLKYSFEAEGIQICTPHLQIETIAAGGGSKIAYFNGMLTVGPQSVGSNPGPVCYGLGEQLAITDANLLLNRLDPDFFPKVFGKHKNQGPKRQLSQQAFAKLTEQINKNSQKKKNMFEIAEGYIEIANELMAKSARKILTLGKPDALVVFGSAGGQHCCDVAEKVGISHIIVHKFSGILSAYGLSKAAESKEQKIYLGLEVNEDNFDYSQLKEAIKKKLEYQKLVDLSEGLTMVEQITVGYSGTSYNMKISLDPYLLKRFEQKHKQDYGFSLPNKTFKIQYYIRTSIKQPQVYKSNVQIKQLQSPALFQFSEAEVFLNGKFQILKKYRIQGMNNCQIKGPALLFSSTSSVLVQSNWIAHVVNESIHLSKKQVQHQLTQITQKQFLQEKFQYNQCDPIRLTIFATRLMGIAQQMGKVLQKTSISTNIKQRLDFSCGIFDWNGHLLANAPHLPVHLGSMQTAVVEQIKRGIKPGDVILSNHPAAGGSHLPDLTVITCFEVCKGMNFYVASRGHHADIGGITPGSMPPFSRKLSQEGVAIEKFQLVRNGQFLDQQTRKLFHESRRVNDNISDLLAQISANEIGAKLIKILLQQYGVHQFRKYVCFVCENAKQCVQNMLVNFTQSRNLPPIYKITNTQFMDDGTPLRLQLTINRDKKEAIFDFTGTGPQVISNTNAPKSITRSAILYCLRSLIGKDIPLNSGCLIPIKIIVPQYSILSPSEDAAVVGGNVQTSQKLVDLILKPFDYVACSQGTMNNFLFGNKNISYYQTICGGSGAGDGFEGTTIQCHMTNTRITDPEHLQKYYPVILLAFKKRSNSGGRGKFKGGDGVIRQVMFVEPMQVSILSQRRVFRPYGLHGGEEGQAGKNILVKNNGVTWNIGSKNCFLVDKFDKVIINTPSGGGYGKQETIID